MESPWLPLWVLGSGSVSSAWRWPGTNSLDSDGGTAPHKACLMDPSEHLIQFHTPVEL